MGVIKTVSKLKSDVNVTFFGKDKKTAEIDISCLYHGYGNYNARQIAEAIIELSDMGYSSGIEVETGYYDSIDGMKLNMFKK